MSRRRPVCLEELEHRLVPALFGIPWADARHLTLSFVPDGTSVDGVGSTLFGTMQANTGLAPTAWQAEILKAVEAWAQNANINVGVVADSGDPLGTPGAAQSDPRFGDIRIAAVPLSANVLAITEPSGYLGGTRAGDIVLNSTAAFSIGGGSGTYDLYSALLQEAGHAFGMSNSTDPASPMFENYSGVRVGLSAGDIGNIQTLYGPRPADAYEGAGGNDTFATARDVSGFGDLYNFATPVLQADISTPWDVDYFKVRTPSNSPNGVTFRLNAGMSLLAPKISVLDAAGNVLTTVQSTNPEANVITATLPTVAANTYYYIKVEAANPAFAVGGYQLTMVFNPTAPVLQWPTAAPTPFNDNHTDDTIDVATRLYTSAGYASNTYYNSLDTIGDAADVDYYRLHSPSVATNKQNVLTVTARALDASALAPLVQVYDNNKQLIASQVLANGQGTYIVQIANTAASQDYYVRVNGQNGGAGTYQLTADFRSQAITFQQLAGKTLTATAAVDFSTLTINRSQIMYFALSAGTVPAGMQAGVRLAVFDANGHVVRTLFAKAGQTVTASTYLVPGTYTLRVEGLTPAGVVLPSLAYTLQGVTLTDPIDPPPDDPSLGGSTTTAPDYTIAVDTSLTCVALVLDSLSSIVW
jgi:hypothetical protein